MDSGIQEKKKFLVFKPFGEAVFPKEYFVKTNRAWLHSWGMLFILYFFGVSCVVSLFFLGFGIFNLIHKTHGYIKSPFLLLADFVSQAAIVFFSADFVLATRLRVIEDLFGGMDRVYKVHSILGRLGMLLITLHFALILGDAKLDWELLSLYIVPGLYWPYSFGLISFLVFLLLILVTVWIKIPYHLWLWTHKVLGVPFILGGVHAWLSVQEYADFKPYRTTLIFIWGVGTIAYLYKLLLFKYMAPKQHGTVVRIDHRGSVFDVYMQVHSQKFRPRPGEFVALSFAKSQNHIKKEFHPFSISGMYRDSIMRLSIKTNGDYTGTLSQASVNDQVIIQGPYGKFGDKFLYNKKDMIWIAGGIGVAPFLFMGEYYGMAARNPNYSTRKVDFFWTMRTESENIYEPEILSITSQAPSMKYYPFYSSKSGRLTAAGITQALGGIEEVMNRTIFICGPVPMMRALTAQFMEMGVKASQIIYEEFQFD